MRSSHPPQSMRDGVIKIIFATRSTPPRYSWRNISNISAAVASLRVASHAQHNKMSNNALSSGELKVREQAAYALRCHIHSHNAHTPTEHHLTPPASYTTGEAPHTHTLTTHAHLPHKRRAPRRLCTGFGWWCWCYVSHPSCPHTSQNVT